MSRLPNPGSDNGTWGNILNDFLAQVHKTDGSLKDDIVTSAAIAPNAVDADAIADGSITEVLLDSAVQTKLNSGGGVPDWSTITNKPAVIAAGADQAAARAAIGAGTASTKSDIGLGNVDNTSDVNKNAAIATLTNKTISGASNTITNIGLASLSATGTPSSTTFLRGDNTWVAGSSITPSWVFNVDNYGADPTGAADSSTAVASAISALGSNPGIIEFGAGTYRLNTGVVLAHPGQYFKGQGIGSTTIDSRVNGVTMRVWDSTVATSGINAPGMGGGLLGGMTISGVNNTNANAIGFQIGDLVGPQVERLKIVSFTTSGAIGFNGMNRYSWTEYGNFDVRADYNTNCIVLESHASHPLYYGGKSSWSYNNMNMSFNVAANQNGVIMRNKISAIGVFWHMNFNAAAATTNTGVMITIGDTGTADCHLEGNLWWEGELTDAGTTGHKDINIGANSAIIGSGSIIFHDYAASFVAGTATAYRVVFAGKVNCPSLGHYIDSVSNNTPFVTIGDSGARFNAKGDAANYKTLLKVHLAAGQ